MERVRNESDINDCICRFLILHRRLDGGGIAARAPSASDGAPLQLAELHPQVVASPDDRPILRTLLETGLQYYELISTRSRFPDSVRRDLLDLKVAMQDMYAIQRAVSEIRRPGRIDGAELAARLKSAKVPFSHRRSVPVVDPWGTPYRFFVHPESGRFKIVSAGRGKKFDPADLTISEKEFAQAPVQRNSTMDDDLVFIDGRNFTRIFDYPKEAESFLYILSANRRTN